MRSVLLRGTKTLASKLMQNTLNLEPRDSHITKQVDDIITKNFKSLHGSSVVFFRISASRARLNVHLSIQVSHMESNSALL